MGILPVFIATVIGGLLGTIAGFVGGDHTAMLLATEAAAIKRASRRGQYNSLENSATSPRLRHPVTSP